MLQSVMWLQGKKTSVDWADNSGGAFCGLPAHASHLRATWFVLSFSRAGTGRGYWLVELLKV